MKNRFFFVCILFLGLFTNAQNKAQVLLDEVSAKMKNYNSYSSEFTYRVENSAKKTKESSKGVVFALANKYNITYFGNTIIFDGTKIYTVDKNTKEITIAKPKTGDDTPTPTNILEVYKKGFSLSLDKSYKLGAKKIQFIKLTPTQKSNYQYILIGIDETKKKLNSMAQVDKKGNSIYFSITKFQINPKIEESKFSFKKENYSDYEITEL